MFFCDIECGSRLLGAVPHRGRCGLWGERETAVAVGRFRRICQCLRKAHTVCGVGLLAHDHPHHIFAQMTAPWNDWYHCNGNTYGTWLRGDPRGWRARHHREHVEGDYTSPPTSDESTKWRQSKSLMIAPPVVLTAEQIQVAGPAMVQRLLDANIELLSLALDDHHYHLVARFPDHNPRHFIGLAKLKATAQLKVRCGLSAPIWAKRCLCRPITSRAHQVRSVQYDAAHAARGAYVWTFRDPTPR